MSVVIKLLEYLIPLTIFISLLEEVYAGMVCVILKLTIIYGLDFLFP